jgi:hypothetical protein
LSDDLIFGIVYIPPEGSSYLSPDAFDQVENAVLLGDASPIGDLTTGTCFIQNIYAPSFSLLQGKHLPFSPSPLRLNITPPPPKKKRKVKSKNISKGFIARMQNKNHKP